ncbi:MAG: DUF1576 domain-containing protein [Oscillospiraceae bacterium]|nr:DUF1576 domain-containing protein [Oscillospiraceae bacterium]
MNKTKYSASAVLKGLFALLTLAFLAAALIAGARGEIFTGLGRILTSPAQITKDYFEVGSVSAAFFNAGLVGAACCLLMCIPGFEASGTTAIAYLLTVGFSFWGMNIVNIWPCMLGSFLYALVRREKPASAVNFAMFSTGLAPLVTDLFLRYPGLENHGYTALGLVLGIAVGCVIGFLTAMGCAHSPNVHKGYSIYSAALPIGMLGFFLRALLYNTLGNELPPIEAVLGDGFPVLCNVFCVVVFLAMAAAGFVLNGRSFAGYWTLLRDTGRKADYAVRYGPGLALMNLGLYGLMIVLYYNLVGAAWTGVTFGVVFCMLATGVSGSHPLNIWPIMAGYVLMSFAGVSAINAQPIIIGLCFASGLTPVAGEYGWIVGIVAGALHYSLVTSVPALHGGFCLYNGGFTCCLLCILLVPVLEKFLKSKSERLAGQAGK